MSRPVLVIVTLMTTLWSSYSMIESEPSLKCHKVASIDLIIEQMDHVLMKLNPADLVHFSMSYRAAKSTASSYLDQHRKFHLVFRDPRYDPNYALKFQEILTVLQSDRYLHTRVKVQDIASAYDRLKADAGADPIKIDNNDEMMNNLIAMLQDNNLTQLLNGLNISDDQNLSDDEKRLLVRDRIDQLQISLNFHPDLVQFLLQLNKPGTDEYDADEDEYDPRQDDVIDELFMRSDGGSINMFDTVLALLQCGRRVDVIDFLSWCSPENVAATLPLLRRSFLDDPNLADDVRRHFIYGIDIYKLIELIHIPQIFTFVRKYGGKFMENRSQCVEFIENILNCNQRSIVEIFKEPDGTSGNTFLHYIAAMEQKSASQAFDLLKNVIDINVANREGDTAAHIAIRHGNLFIFNEVAGRDGFDATIANNKGDTLLHELFRMKPGDDVTTSFQLLMKHNIDINAVNQDGDTAAHIALQNHGWDAVSWIAFHSLLMRDDFDPTIVNKKGKTVPDLTRQLGYWSSK